MSEKLFTSRSSTSRVRAVGLGALVFSSALTGAAITDARQPERPGIEQIQDLVQNQIRMHHNAVQESYWLAVDINDTVESGGTAFANVLNGKVKVKDRAGEATWVKPFVFGGYYKGVSDLSQLKGDELLDGQWLGLQTLDNEGKVAITVLPYDADAMEIQLDDPDHALTMLQIRAFAPRKGGGDVIAHTAYAVNPQDPSQILLDLGGQPIIPGQGIGTK